MFRTLSILISILFCCGSHAEANESKEKEMKWCDSHREFVTTLEYMRQQDFYELGEQHSQKVAGEVAKGCNGAAQRYVKVYELLKKVEAGARTSINTAIEFSHSTDEHVTSFMNVFKNAYDQKRLDLDISNSIKIAKGLSIDYKGDPKKAKKDYDQLVAFCLDQEKIGGSIPVCASIAFEIAKSAENFKEPTADSFIKTYEFLKNHKDLNFQISKAIDVAKKVVAIHPKAADNYIASFQYATSKSGLNIAASKTLDFAFEMASHTRPIEMDAANEGANRLPASGN